MFPSNLGIPQSIDSRILERNFGDATLKSKAYLQRDVGLRGYEAALYGELDHCILNQGESFKHFRARVLEFLRDELHPLLLKGQRVLVVAHKYVIELLARLILRLPPGDGHDLRLPNAQVVQADGLLKHFQQESRTGNLVRDWMVLHHGKLLILSTFLGLALGVVIDAPLSPWPAVILLMLVTAISLARVDLTQLFSSSVKDSVSYSRMFLRFILLPIAVVQLASIIPGADQLALFSCILAAPVATTAVTLSRCNGGLILPTAAQSVVSAFMGAIALPLILFQQQLSDLMLAVQIWVSITLVSLFIPLAVVIWLRRQHPIATAKFGENNGALAVLLLCLFVIFACQKIELESFLTNGWPIFMAGIALRLVSLWFARHDRLYGVDDYLSSAFPNVFVVMIAADLMQLHGLSEAAAWFLIPMFLFTPLDEKVCRDWLYPAQEAHLRGFLRISH